MKKLSLEMLRLTSDEVLQRSQMKKITGGYGGGWDVRTCDCRNGAVLKIVTCTVGLVNQGGDRCCSASYGSGWQQSNCRI